MVIYINDFDFSSVGEAFQSMVLLQGSSTRFSRTLISRLQIDRKKPKQIIWLKHFKTFLRFVYDHTSLLCMAILRNRFPKSKSLVAAVVGFLKSYVQQYTRVKYTHFAQKTWGTNKLSTGRIASWETLRYSTASEWLTRTSLKWGVRVIKVSPQNYPLLTYCQSSSLFTSSNWSLWH